MIHLTLAPEVVRAVEDKELDMASIQESIRNILKNRIGHDVVPDFEVNVKLGDSGELLAEITKPMHVSQATFILERPNADLLKRIKEKLRDIERLP